MANALQSILTQAGPALVPLRAVKTAPQAVVFFRQIGYEIPAGAFGSVLNGLSTKADELFEAVRDLGSSTDETAIITAIADVFTKLVESVDAIRQLHQQILSAAGGIPDIDQLPRRLTDFLILDYLYRYRTDSHEALHLLGLIEHEPTPPPGVPVRIINWNRFGQFLKEPARIANDVYNWESDFDTEKFLTRLENVMRADGLPGGLYPQSDAARAALGNTSSGLKELRLPILQKGTT